MIAATLMTRDVISLSPRASLADAVEVMQREHIRHLPVVSDDGMLLGLLSDRDMRELSLAAVLAPDAADMRARLAQPIGPLAGREGITVTPETELCTVIDTMLERRIGAVMVVETDGHRLVGVVSDVDVLRALRDRA